MTPGAPRPPRLPSKVLERVLPCGPAGKALLGDLEELWRERRSRMGALRANAWYISQALGIVFRVRPAPARILPAGAGAVFGARARQILRRLAWDWHYSSGVVLVLAIGTGAATVGLSVRQGVLVRPLGYREPDRLGVVRVDIRDMTNHPGLAQTVILDLRELEGVFKSVEWAIFGSGALALEDEDISLMSAGVSKSFFQTLGVKPSMGRSFIEGDPWDGVAILGHGLWQARFGGDPNVIGRTVRLWGRAFEVVGVLPPEFRFRLGTGSNAPDQVDIWTLVRATRANRQTGFLWGWNALVRLEDGVSFEQANQALEEFARRQVQAYPQVYFDSSPRFTVVPLLADLVRDVGPAIRAVLFGLLLLLATAVVNASALVALASKKREREMAIQRAVGADRGTLLLESTCEALILGTAGIALGWLLAGWGVAGVRAIIPRAVPRWETIALEWESAALVAAIALAGVVLAGVLSAWRAGRGTLTERLEGAAGGGRGRGHSALVGVQVAMAVALLFAAVQLARSARSLALTDLGFEPEHVVAFEVALDFPGFTADDRSWENQRYQLIRDRLRALPGVQAVGAVSSPPLMSRGTVNTFQTDPLDAPAPGGERVANFYAVLPGYFESVDIRLLQGRAFTDAENADGLPVAVIDRTLAETAFRGVNPIGRTLRVDVPGGSRTPRLPDLRIVGVVGHARVIDPTREVRPQIYLPFGLWRWAPLYFTVRTKTDPSEAIPAARAIVQELGVAGQPVSRIQLLTDNLAGRTSTLRSVAILAVIVALSASVLCLVGLFAVASYAVMQKRRAIAIRGALGASPNDLLREQLGGRGRLLAVAVPAGMLLALAGARVLESLVYGVGIRDAESLLTSATLGVLLALLGTYVPARQAAKIDPASVLKAE